MRTQLSVLTALIAVWLAVIGLMALAPDAAGMRSARADTGQTSALASDPQIFSHTGLWVTEVGADGTTAVIRDLRRQ